MTNEELRRGDLVEVRSASEILATLDEKGALGELPFMPEMAAFCGRRFAVERRAERVCDTVAYSGSRRSPETVLLADLRCDGSAHGGCQAECRYLWKEAWLRKVGPETAVPPPISPRDLEPLVERTARNAKYTATVDGRPQERWRCQATELPRATEHIKFYDPRSYIRELTSGNVGLGRFLRVMGRVVVKEPMRKLGLIPEIHLPGKRTQPVVDPPLNLQPGELVQVKSKEEIAETLSPQGRHRGLWFDREMMPYCGRTFRVRQRVNHFIDDRDGKMIELKNDCVTLEGAVCTGDHSLLRWFCPREILPYWREVWLRRVEPASARPSVAAGAPGARPDRSGS
jgi:hypothetical protein